MTVFECDRGALPERGVSAVRVVSALDEAEDGEAGFGARGEAMPSEALALERREKTLGHRVSVRITARAHRGVHTERATAFPEGKSPILPEFHRSLQQCW